MPPRLLSNGGARGRIAETGDQAIEIGRATFTGFLQSDLMPQGMQAPALIWAAAFLVGPALFIPIQFLQKYPFLRRYLPSRVPAALIDDRVLFLTLSCSAIGLVAVVLWETMFPSRRDAFVLGTLPVSREAQTVGRLLGLGALFVAFALTLNAIPAALFAFIAAPGLTDTPRWTLAHAVACTCADAFVFFTITMVQGLTLLGAGARVAARVAVLLQAFSVVLVLLTLLMLGGMQQLVRQAFLEPQAHAVVLAWFPPAWFAALFAWIADGGGPGAGVAARGVVAALAPVVATVAIYVLGYARLSARALETRKRTTRSLIARTAAAIVRIALIRRSEEQALCSFFVRVLTRSERHRMLVSAAIGVAIAIALAGIAPDFLRGGRAGFAQPSEVLFAAALVLGAALAVSVRLVMTIPVDLPARWALMATPLSRRRIDAATHKGMLLVVLPPVAVAAAATTWPLWGSAIGLAHAAFCSTLTWVLCEVLLVGFHGVPFARQYVPGKARIHTLWPVYLGAFGVFTYGMAAFEIYLMPGTDPLIAAGLFAAIAASIALSRIIARRGDDEIEFESDLLDDSFRGFNLTEAFAAERVGSSLGRDE